MDCSRAREGLWPPERPRLVHEDVVRARAHVDSCPDCIAYFEQDRALLDLYDRVRRHSAPLSIREQVFDALAQARWSSAADSASSDATAWVRRATLPAALAAVLAVAFFAELRSPPSEAPGDSSMFVEDYLRRAVGQDHIDTDEPAEVQRFLQRELGLQLGPLQLAGLVIQRAEICLLEGRRGAMIVYKKDGADVSHYLVPREGTVPRAPSLSSYPAANGGAAMPVVTWATPRVEQALVGGVSEEELLALARSGASRP